ncbi:MAG: thiamine phosphate synthase [Archaeoglobaceae archaeon]|nr:thiamine phosphate synthase [Archaeoglobaceae archaeon]MDW7989222.1 thiamine phosphate synthase [Archaeoglobaceae archaeon]
MLRGVYFITDSKFGDHEEMVKKALELGIRIIQFREKRIKDRERYFIAKKLREIIDCYDALFIVNDRVDIAIAVDADGVHLGQEDLPIEVVREIFDGLIGISVHNVEEARKAKNADYVGVGPIFRTTTKEDARNEIGIPGLIEIMKELTIPVFAIGGINIKNVVEVLKCGVSGVAVVSAVAGDGAKDFVDTVKKYLK